MSVIYSDHYTIYNSEHQRFYKILINILKCPDNTIIADFSPCAYFYNPSGVTRDPYMAWRSISQSGAIILSAMHYGI